VSTRQVELEELLKPVVVAMGCELWGLEYLPQRNRAILRVFVDSADGVTLDDCEKISRQVSSVLDVEDPITVAYTLEVSSPGLDRPLYRLAQYRQFAGEGVSLRLRFPYEGRRNFKGRLQAVEGEDVVIICGDEEYLFPIDAIEKANIISRV